MHLEVKTDILYIVYHIVFIIHCLNMEFAMHVLLIKDSVFHIQSQQHFHKRKWVVLSTVQ